MRLLRLAMSLALLVLLGLSFLPLPVGTVGALGGLRTSAEGELQILTFAGLASFVERAHPVPRAGSIGRDEPASHFRLIPK